MAKIGLLLDYWDSCLHDELYIHILYKQFCVLMPVSHGTVTTKAVVPVLVPSYLIIHLHFLLKYNKFKSCTINESQPPILRANQALNRVGCFGG